MTRQHRPDLAADLSPEEREQLGDLGPLAGQLARYDAPEPPEADTATLIARLAPTVAARTETKPAAFWDDIPANGGVNWLALARAQLALVDPSAFWAAGLVFALGLLVTALGRGGLLALGFTLGAPILAAAGVAYAFRPAGRTLGEIERLSPVSLLELLYVRLGLVLSANLVLTLALLALTWVEMPRLILWRLLLLWLGPMLGIAGAALVVAARWGTLPGIAVPLGLWSVIGFIAWRAATTPPASGPLTATVILDRLSHMPAVMFGALLLLVTGVLLLHLGTRLVARQGELWS